MRFRVDECYLANIKEIRKQKPTALPVEQCQVTPPPRCVCRPAILNDDSCCELDGDGRETTRNLKNQTPKPLSTIG